MFEWNSKKYFPSSFILTPSFLKLRENHNYNVSNKNYDKLLVRYQSVLPARACKARVDMTESGRRDVFVRRWDIKAALQLDVCVISSFLLFKNISKTIRQDSRVSWILGFISFPAPPLSPLYCFYARDRHSWIFTCRWFGVVVHLYSKWNTPDYPQITVLYSLLVSSRLVSFSSLSLLLHSIFFYFSSGNLIPCY